MGGGLQRCVIVDDHAVVREAVRIRLEGAGLAEVVGEAANGLDGIELIASLEPEVALVDLRLPAASGLEVARELAARGCPTAVVIYSACTDDAMVEQARRSGARGFVAKDAPLATLEAALRHAHMPQFGADTAVAR